MKEFFENEVVAGLTGLHLVLIAVGGIILLTLIAKVFSPKPQPPAHRVEMSCPSCGWRGNLSRYNPTCPRCNNRIV